MSFFWVSLFSLPYDKKLAFIFQTPQRIFSSTSKLDEVNVQDICSAQDMTEFHTRGDGNLSRPRHDRSQSSIAPGVKHCFRNDPFGVTFVYVLTVAHSKQEMGVAVFLRQ